MLKLAVKKADAKYVSGLLDVLHNHFRSKVRFEKPQLSATIMVEIEGEDEEQFGREIQAFGAHVGWQVETK
jgi:hypothetical protein